MSLEEFLNADVVGGYRYELAQGIVEVTNVPNDPHGVPVSNLYTAIALYHKQHSGVIQCYGGGSEFQFLLPRMISGRNPDLGVVLHGAPKDWRGRRIAALASEVVSRGSIERDYVTRREEYLAYGLIEYRIADPLERKVTVLTRRGDLWHETIVRDEQVIPSLVLPGLAASPVDLWEGLDEELEPVATTEDAE